MAAIPDAVGARRASRGVIRAVLRVAVLGGLVIAGWLVGSGIGQAHEDTVDESQAQHSSLTQMIDISPPNDDSGGLLSAPAVARSAGAEVMRAAPVPPLPIQPAQTPVLAPALEPVSKLAAPAPSVAESATQSRAAAPMPAAVAPPAAAPAAPAIAVTAASTPAPVLRAAADPPPETPVCRTAHQAADPSADQLAVPSSPGVGPATPLPASSPGTTTEPCPAGNTGGGSITTSAHLVTLSDRWSTATRASRQCRLCPGASGIARSAAQRPSTSPD